MYTGVHLYVSLCDKCNLCNLFDLRCKSVFIDCVYNPFNTHSTGITDNTTVGNAQCSPVCHLYYDILCCLPAVWLASAWTISS